MESSQRKGYTNRLSFCRGINLAGFLTTTNTGFWQPLTDSCFQDFRLFRVTLSNV